MLDHEIAWHPAFFRALEIELEAYSEHLEFIPEYQLSKEPLRVDIIVIRKDAGIRIEKNIGRIFKGHNLVEYKSPTDGLSIDDYHKVLGYAHFYYQLVGNKNIRIEDITITFAVNGYPKNLIAYLKAHGRTVTKVENGIYTISDQDYAIQILVRKQLKPEDNLWLSSLTNDLDQERIIDLMAAKDRHPKEAKYEEYFTTLFDGNIAEFMEVYKMSKATRQEAIAFFEEVVEEQGWKERYVAQGREEGRTQGREEGRTQGREEGVEMNKLETAKSLLDLLTDQVIATKVGLPLAKVKALREASGQ